MLELLPVIKIGYSNQGVITPVEWPYWKYPVVWNNYNEESYIRAGFKDKLLPYLPGSSFYRLNDISQNNLVKLTIDHTEAMRNGYETTEPFGGGYVLRINSQDKYFPQCCGDLSDIIYWEKLLIEDKPFFYQGHPEPRVEITNNTVIFDFTVDEYEEHFAPTPPNIRIEFNKADLLPAIVKAKEELHVLAERLKEINKEQQLNIPNIDKLLIWSEDHDTQ